MANAGPVPGDANVPFTREDALDDLVATWSKESVATAWGTEEKWSDDTLPFRLSLRSAEASVKKLEDLVRLLLQWSVRAVQAAPLGASSANGTFTQTFTSKDAPQQSIATLCVDFANLSHQSDTTQDTLHKISTALVDLERAQQIASEQIKGILQEACQHFLDVDVVEVQNTRQKLDKSTSEYQDALNKFHTKRQKEPSDPLMAELKKARAKHMEVCMTYSVLLDELQNTKRLDMLLLKRRHQLLAFVYTQCTCFHQGFEIMKDVEPILKQLHATINKERQAWKEDKKQLSPLPPPTTRVAFKRPLPKPPTVVTDSIGEERKEEVATRVIKAGYLMKHTTSKVSRHTWVRRYFCLLHLNDRRLAQEEYVLAYYNGEKLNERGTVVTDIQTSTVRRLNGRPHASSSASLQQPTALVEAAPTSTPDAPCTFEIISPQRQLVLQAEDEETMLGWITALQQAIASALVVPQRSLPPSPIRVTHTEMDEGVPTLTLQTQSPHGPSSSAPSSASVFKQKVDKFVGHKQHHSLARHASSSHHRQHRSAAQKEAENEVLEILADIKQLAVNQVCADCGDAQPTWASINLGVLLCIECSGIHRSLGVHLSKVRSLDLDRWEAANAVLLQQLGNRAAASIFEASYDASSTVKKANPASSRQEREGWIRAKYADKTFVWTDHLRALYGAPDQQQALHRALFDAVSRDQPQSALRYLVLGARQSSMENKVDGSLDHRPNCLMKATEKGSAAMAELLLHWAASLDDRDDQGWTALHYAIQANHVGLCLTFLRRGASIHSDTPNGDALQFALGRKRPNAEIVTLLRLHQFNKDHKDSFDSLSNLFVPHDVFMSPRRSRQTTANEADEEKKESESEESEEHDFHDAPLPDLTDRSFEGLHRSWSNASTSSSNQ